MESELWPNLIMSAAEKGVSSSFMILVHHQLPPNDHSYILISSV
jgi:3-deoxy-D-manno-octulosonic-acid transferase